MELTIIGIFVIIALWYVVKRFMPDSNCNQDCDQGRNCNCNCK